MQSAALSTQHDVHKMFRCYACYPVATNRRNTFILVAAERIGAISLQNCKGNRRDAYTQKRQS